MSYETNMQSLLGVEEYRAYEKAMERHAVHALRCNPLKMDAGCLKTLLPWKTRPVPWCEDGLLVDRNIRPGRFPLHAAGAYYLQEPSAMAPVALLSPQKGERVLDLCAAPGGKSGQAAAAIGPEGFLLASEPIPSRAKALVSNLSRLGIGNAWVTQETPERLSKRFEGYFDCVIVDAPCSGEGMFRRDPEARAQWTDGFNEGCAQRQAVILEEAWKMLRRGGRMVYSTCTFSQIENEDQIRSFLQKHSDALLLTLPEFPGFVKGIDGIGVRLYPHRLEGEGQYAVLLQKGGFDENERDRIEYDHKYKIPQPVRDFFDDALPKMELTKDGARIIERSGHLYLLSRSCPDERRMQGIRVIMPGLYLGENKGRYFVPSHALALQTETTAFAKETLDYLPEDDAVMRYLSGESIPVDPKMRGWRIVTCAGLALGWVKCSGGQGKNHFPKEERFPSGSRWYYEDTEEKR